MIDISIGPFLPTLYRLTKHCRDAISSLRTLGKKVNKKVIFQVCIECCSLYHISADIVYEYILYIYEYISHSQVLLHDE